MAHRGTKAGKIIAGAYLILVIVSLIPLIKDQAIHHGNGIAFLAAIVLTTPLSWLFFWLIDRATEVNAFYVNGWSFLLSIATLAACALFNAGVIYYLLGRLFPSKANSTGLRGETADQ